ncbi:LuxR C-terminal-related transcriptional regulator [Antrihabitans spumae]|uniref:LuxR C-terminal-related transcriptional regulator n=1 Tax=Antrihabitans spumae TaxID=3373370 RepID=A0ABW7K015_9NOCA
MGTAWPTLGRATHLDAIGSSLLPSSGANGVVLTGGAGVGKTTLAKDAVRDAGVPFKWVVGTETARRVPLGAFAHLISVTSPIEPATVLRSARRDIVAGMAGMIIGVDDAHLLDNFSATLVHQLAMGGSARLVVTIRDNEPAPDAITALWKDEWLHRIELSSFTREQTIDLSETVLGGPLEAPSADRIFRVSEGNPLFLRHLIEGALDAGSLREVAGVWQLRGEAAITPHLNTLVESRINSLSDTERRVLELLSFSEPLDLDVLTDLSSADAVEAAERDGLVRVTSGEAGLVARLGHPLYGEVLSSQTASLTARRIRSELVRRMSVTKPTHIIDKIRLAALALDSDIPPNPELLVDAARDALRMGAITLGERLANGAKAGGGGFYASVYLGFALAWLGRGEEVEAELGQYDPAALSEMEMLVWGLPRAANFYWMLGRPAQGRALLELMKGRATEKMVDNLLDALDATFMFYESRLSEAVDVVARLMDSPASTPLARAWAGSSGAVSLAFLGRFDEVEALAEPGLEAATLAESGNVRFTCGLGQTFALIMTGRLDDAHRLAKHYVDFAEQQQPGRSIGGVLLGQVLFARGDLPAACAEFKSSAAGLEGTGYSWAMLSATHLAQAAAALGRRDEAHDALARAERLFGDNVAIFEPELLLARAWVAASDGDSPTARSLARQAADVARNGGQTAVLCRMLTTAAQFGDRTIAADLVTAAGAVPGEFATAAGKLGAALLEAGGRELLSVSAEFERMGLLLIAADLAALASAEYATAGQRSDELSAAAAAQRLSALCGHALTPALLVSARSLPLTNREREVAKMIADGLSNRDIADRLVVSVRTVEGHIYRACTKLEVVDRAALAAAVSAENR